MDAETACLLLGRAGFPTEPEAVSVEVREERWAVTLPGDRMAWFPMNEAATKRLAVERRLLDLLAARCSFRAPRMLHADEAGWHLRELVPGLYDPWGLFRRVQAEPALARRIGQALGGILAEQHARIGPEDVAGWLPARLPWPEPSDQLRDRLRGVVMDAGLLRVIERVLKRYELQQDEAPADDRVLNHGDLGLHNIALVPDTDEVAGVFDYDGAAWADRHQDFRYLLFPGAAEETMLDGALEIYESLLGLRLDRERIRLGNAACAIGFLAFRCGTPPEEHSCGRTLAEDLYWVTHALQGLGEVTVSP
jgi:aminoglycoside phosphotransferase (APT) family kinase protein